MKKNRRNKLKDDLVTAIVLFFILFTFVAIVFLVEAKDSPKRSDFVPVEYVVRLGDTPWTIADRYCPEGMDKRLYLEWCAKENGLKSFGYIYPGERILFLEMKGIDNNDL